MGSAVSNAVSVFDRVQATVCSNRVDDDGDGRIDYPGDPGCTDSQDTSEVDPPAPPAPAGTPGTAHSPARPPAPPTCLGERATIVAGPGQLRVTGTAGPDVIVGNALGNKIKGLGGKDVVCSLGGADRVDPGKGKDRVDAGAGLDRVDLVDGARDSVSCGSGKRDRVSLDESDRARKCEVERLPGVLTTDVRYGVSAWR